MLAAHTYWRHKGLEADLVILNEDQSGYFDDLQNQLLGLVRASDDRGLVDKPGGVFVRKATHMPHEDRILFQAAARCVLAGNRGSLATQMDRLERGAGPAPRPPRRRDDGRGTRGEQFSRPSSLDPQPSNAATPDLLFDNGIGGFTQDGREYAIRLAPVPGRRDEGRRAREEQLSRPSPFAPRPSNASPSLEFPPAPWSNVIANPSFGFLVTERGGGYTWAGNNSQLNRLTPWSNDAASDPPGEVVYLRDEATGEVWTPTALAPRGPAAYTAHHGQGYTAFTYSGRGLDHELLLFVPLADPIKLIRLKVRNVGRQPRRLSATFFAEWVLGTVRDQSLHARRYRVRCGQRRAVGSQSLQRGLCDGGGLCRRQRSAANMDVRSHRIPRPQRLTGRAGRAVGARSGDRAKAVERQRRRCARSLRRAPGILRPSTRRGEGDRFPARPSREH